MLAIVFWILILGIIWRVPEFKFLAFFIFANNALSALLVGWAMTSAEWQPYLLNMAKGDLIFAAIATPVIIFRKWQKSRGSVPDSNDREMERIRAEIRARDGGAS
ncbi:hypothetical protein [Terricaulis sp.]|uniref:hypothetical protein n=1 Tax=Terricaulis sp. TaxID=2768686 RepID=UPI00378389F8